jgi:hypothetical protein
MDRAAHLVPFWYCFAFGISVIGASLGFAGLSAILQTFSDMNATGSRIDTSGLSAVFIISFVALLGLNAFSVLHGLVGTGCLRETIFGTKHQAGKWYARWAQCMLGPLATCVLRVLLWLSFTFQVFLSYMYLLLYVVLAAIGTNCGMSDADTARSLIGINHVLRETGIGSVDIKFVHDFCSSTNDVDQAALLAFIGCVLSVASQSILSSALSAEIPIGSKGGSDEARHLTPRNDGSDLSAGSPRHIKCSQGCF